MEIWKDVVGYEGWYEVSDYGRVRSVGRVINTRRGRRVYSGAVLSPTSSRGYTQVNLCRSGSRKSYPVHRLVAMAFLGPIPPGHQINHKDLRRDNPCVSNLEYVTPSGNIQHALHNGAIPVGEAHYSTKLTDADAKAIIQSCFLGARQSDIAASYGLSVGAVADIVAGRRWKHLDRPYNGTPPKQYARGERQGSSSLTADDVREIVRRNMAGESPTQISKDYPVTRSGISSVVNGHTWTHITGLLPRSRRAQ